jgi:hypothetical protein
MRAPLRSFVPVIALLAAVAAPSSAYAQSESDKATARQLGQQGQSALDAHEWKRAEDDFRRADALYHAPSLVLGLARAQVKEGKFVEAWENYNRIILENVTTSPVFVKALADAKSEIGTVEKRRSRVTLTVTGPAVPRVLVDDVPVKAEALGIERFIDPGHHTVTSAADGWKRATKTFDIVEGASQTVVLVLDRDVSAVAIVEPVPVGTQPPSPASGQVLTPTQSGSGASVQRTLGIVAVAVGGAGVILGAVTGIVALGKHSDLSKECPMGTCSVANQSSVDSYHTMGTLSTVGFIVGGVGLAGGAALYFTAPKAHAVTSGGATFTPYLGFGTLGAVGTF